MANKFMTSNKRVRLDARSNRNFLSTLSHDILFNSDLLSVIFKHLRIYEIIWIAKTNKFIYNYLKINNKSIPVIKACIFFDFGDILSCKQFSFTWESSVDLIKQI